MAVGAGGRGALVGDGAVVGVLAGTATAIVGEDSVMLLAVATANPVCPPFDGGVQIEWREAHAEVEIDVDADGVLSYLYVDKASTERRFEEGEGVDWRAAIDLVTRVLVPPSTR